MALLTESDLSTELQSDRDVNQLQVAGADVFGRCRFSLAAWTAAVTNAHNGLSRDAKLLKVLRAMRTAFAMGVSSTAVFTIDYGGGDNTTSLRAAFQNHPNSQRGDWRIGLSASETFPAAWSTDYPTARMSHDPTPRERLYTEGLLP